MFHARSLWSGFVVIWVLGFITALPLCGLDKKEYQVYIVLDTQFDKFLEVQDGFKASLDKQLAAKGSKATYTYLDTKLDAAQAATVVKAIKDGKPDLVCVVNWPSAFADINVTLKLSDPTLRFVSLNPIPVQSGVAKTWQKPGGNATGVGVFLQFDSMLKVAKKLRPQLKEVAFYTWDAMKELNAYFEPEIRAACQREGLKLIDFKLNASVEDEFDWIAKMDKDHPNAALIGGISAWVHRDGSAADTLAEGGVFLPKNIRHVILMTYDEATMKSCQPVGTCVIWFDIGAQLADKGYKILSGAKPGDMAWEYPRKYNLMFNTALAKLIGLTIPNDLLSAAYRVYTDFDGHYAGQKN
jgi:ABC-type uncharacterized transport system substrate-binding protein